MAQMRPVARNITVKPVVPMAYSSAKERAPEEKKELVINVYQERSSMRGIERTFGVSRRTVSAWLKEQANDLPPLEETLQSVDSKKIPVLEGDELRSSVFRSKDKVWVWIAMNGESREIVASACGDRSENTSRILWDRVPSAYKEAIVHGIYTPTWSGLSFIARMHP